MKKHLMIAMGEKCYLALPENASLAEGHCLIIPIGKLWVWKKIKLSMPCLVFQVMPPAPLSWMRMSGTRFNSFARPWSECSEKIRQRRMSRRIVSSLRMPCKPEEADTWSLNVCLFLAALAR